MKYFRVMHFVITYFSNFYRFYSNISNIVAIICHVHCSYLQDNFNHFLLLSFLDTIYHSNLSIFTKNNYNFLITFLFTLALSPSKHLKYKGIFITFTYSLVIWHVVKSNRINTIV